MRGDGLSNPAFDVHHHARAGGRKPNAVGKIPYAPAIAVSSETTRDLYDTILRRYPTILEPLKPAVGIPIRT